MPAHPLVAHVDWNPAHWVLVSDSSLCPCPLLVSACAHCPIPFLVLVPFGPWSTSKGKGTHTHDDHKEILLNWGRSLYSPGAWVSWAGNWEVLGCSGLRGVVGCSEHGV